MEFDKKFTETLPKYLSDAVKEFMHDAEMEGIDPISAVNMINQSLAINHGNVSESTVPHVDLIIDERGNKKVIGAKHLREPITEITHPGLAHLSPMVESTPEQYMGMFMLAPNEFVPARNYAIIGESGFVISKIAVPDIQSKIMAVTSASRCTEIPVGMYDDVTPHTIDRFGYDNGTKINANGEFIFVDSEVNRFNEEREQREELIALLKANAGAK